jgi:hypothetical protein
VEKPKRVRKRASRTGEKTIPRLLAFAFKHANAGETAKALEFWETAISRGYVIDPKTERNLQHALRQATGQTAANAQTEPQG